MSFASSATGRHLTSWVWLIPAALGGAVTALVMLVLPADRTLHGIDDFALKLSPLVFAVATIAFFPRRHAWVVYLPVVSFIFYLGYVDSAFFIQVDRLVQASQAGIERAEFAAYYRFAIFANAFVVLSGVFAFRMGGATSVQVVKLGCAGILVLVSGLNDLTMWAMYDWPAGVRPDTFDWASHVSVFLGRAPHLVDMLAFASVHLLLMMVVLRLPLERLSQRVPSAWRMRSAASSRCEAT